MLKAAINIPSLALSQRMRRSNSSRSVGRTKSGDQEGVIAAAPASSELEQQASFDQLPLLRQQSHAHATTSSPWHVKALSAINESTKWAVSATVFAVLLWQHNEYAAWCVVGAVFSSFVCKVLKHVINQQRPDNGQKSDPGMPSSHANSLNFLSVYAALSLDHHTRSHPVAVSLAFCSVFLGAFLTWLRVRLGYHTWPQVFVGAALGASTAAGWFFAGAKAALPALQQTPAGLPLLYTITLLAMAAFAIKNVLAWASERKQRRQLRQQQLQRQQQISGLQQKLQQGLQLVPQADEQGTSQPAPVAAALAN